MAWEVARLLGAELPVFATLVPLLATKDDPFSAFNVSAARLLGVTAGVVLGLAALEVDGASALGVGVVLLVGLALGAFVRLGPERKPGRRLGAARGRDRRGDGTPAGYALDRLWETAIGAVVTLALAPLLWPPDPLAEVRARLARLRSWLVDDLRTTATLFGGGEGPLEDISTRSSRAPARRSSPPKASPAPSAGCASTSAGATTARSSPTPPSGCAWPPRCTPSHGVWRATRSRSRGATTWLPRSSAAP